MLLCLFSDICKLCVCVIGVNKKHMSHSKRSRDDDAHARVEAFLDSDLSADEDDNDNNSSPVAPPHLVSSPIPGLIPDHMLRPDQRRYLNGGGRTGASSRRGGNNSPIPDTASVGSGMSLDTSASQHAGSGVSRGVRRTQWKVTYWGEDMNSVTDDYMRNRMEQVKASGGHVTMMYGVWQVEHSPSTDRRHLQGYFEFSCTVWKNFVSSLFPTPSQCWTRPRGNEPRANAIAYCKKEGTRIHGPYEYGQFDSTRTQGTRSDIASLGALIKDGATLEDVLEVHPNALLRMPHGIRTAMSVARGRTIPKSRDVKVRVIFGSTGTGKSSGVIMGIQEPLYTVDSTLLSVGSHTIWWEGYQGENHVLWDDYHDWVPTADLLRYLDRYSIKIQSKGGYAHGCWENMYITSNKPPWHWKDPKTRSLPFPAHRAALMRRMHTIAEVMHGVTVLHKLNGRIINHTDIEQYTGEVHTVTSHAAAILGNLDGHAPQP